MEKTEELNHSLRKETLIRAIVCAYDNNVFLNSKTLDGLFCVFDAFSRESNVVIYGGDETGAKVVPKRITFRAHIDDLFCGGYLRLNAPDGLKPTKKAYEFLENKDSEQRDTKIAELMSGLESVVRGYAENNSYAKMR